jgi:hypothetical protein
VGVGDTAEQMWLQGYNGSDNNMLIVVFGSPHHCSPACVSLAGGSVGEVRSQTNSNSV